MITIPVRLHCECRASLAPINASVVATMVVKRKCRSCGRQYQVVLEPTKYIPGEICVHLAKLKQI